MYYFTTDRQHHQKTKNKWKVIFMQSVSHQWLKIFDDVYFSSIFSSFILLFYKKLMKTFDESSSMKYKN